MNIAAHVRVYNESLVRAADGFALTLAIVLPWSTTATGIFVVAWLLAFLPTLELDALRRRIITPAGGLPVLLVVLGALGMLWAEVSWAVAFKALTPFAKLLLIPLLLIHFHRSSAASKVFKSFLISAAVLLALSLAFEMGLKLPWFPGRMHPVPVKDTIAQASEFVICALGAAYVAIDYYRARRYAAAGALVLLSALFLLNVLLITTNRTALVVLPFLLVLLGWRQFGWKGVAGVFIAMVVLGATVWMTSSFLQRRANQIMHEIQVYQQGKKITSVGERLYYWEMSLGIIAEAPFIGHGTGSIKQTFEKAAAGITAPWAEATTNPHNQTFAVGIQLGLVGIAVLFAMWLSHALLFRGQGLIAGIGLMVVAQNVVSSVFNSHLFDFTQGWIYVLGVGIAGGAILRDAGNARREQA